MYTFVVAESEFSNKAVLCIASMIWVELWISAGRRYVGDASDLFFWIIWHNMGTIVYNPDNGVRFKQNAGTTYQSSEAMWGAQA